jgi:ATP-dependent Clp protease ATP-binding subunit ClpC
VSIDPDLLSRFGTDLTDLAVSGKLPRAHGVAEACETLLKLIQREPWRSIALLGPAGVGKTALIHELTHHLIKPENGAWRVLRVSPAEFMAGTKYSGEWETKVRDLVAAIKIPRRVVLYVPNLGDLSAAGTWSKSDLNVAGALAPHMDEGSIILLGESTPEEFERGLGAIPSLVRLFDKVLLPEPGPERSREILAAVRTEQKSDLSDELLERLMEVSGQFLSHISRPGNAVELLKAAMKSEKESGRAVTFRDVLDILSKSTGVPGDLLDDAIPLNAVALRKFFEEKIIGQSEAVQAVIDLITMIKAGVTDPAKPFAVFLFVGPTGVGKTELARALAEFIFGDAARLKRFDMSEFADYDGFTRLIGGKRENGLLTDAVRQHPFSVVLLDEIEKAHLNVFDLCLQIFDAGRLTDGRGRTIDFRRTIVVLTSNIGATTATPTLGFGTPTEPTPDTTDKDRTLRTLSRFFRPEFLNRLDRIIHFRPLSLQVAEQIARREVGLVLQRSGISRRQLVVEIDPAVIALLVREGYSPHFGARPLKRTVERLLLLPLARAISNGSLRGRTVLRLAERDGRVEAVVTVPPGAKPKAEPEREELKSPLRDRMGGLRELHARVSDSIQPLADRKSELIVLTQHPDFARNAETRSATLGEIHNLDQLLHLHQGVGKALTGLQERFDRGAIAKNEEGAVGDKLDQLAAEVAQLVFVSRCQDARELGDALVAISLVDRVGASQESAVTFAKMYQALAVRRRMTAEVLGEFYDEKQDRVYLLIGGLGAYALLRNESGLHQIDRRFKERTARGGKEVIREDRELLRVEVYPAGTLPPKQLRQKVKSKCVALKPVKNRLVKAGFALSMFDEQSLRSVEFWTHGPRAAALERGVVVLHAVANAKPAAGAAETVIRHYDVGLSPRIKDVRTGRTTTRVEKVFKGELNPFLEMDGGDELRIADCGLRIAE